MPVTKPTRRKPRRSLTVISEEQHDLLCILDFFADLDYADGYDHQADRSVFRVAKTGVFTRLGITGENRSVASKVKLCIEVMAWLNNLSHEEKLAHVELPDATIYQPRLTGWAATVEAIEDPGNADEVLEMLAIRPAFV